MSIPHRRIVNWPSAITALVVDSLVIWIPALGVLRLTDGRMLALAGSWIVLAALVGFARYRAGVTMGSLAAGFRFASREGHAPGWGYAALLSLASVAVIPAIAVLFLLNYFSGNGTPESLSGYPVIGVRTSRRRLLEAADNYWRRWSY